MILLAGLFLSMSSWAQVNDKELEDPKPGDQQVWTNFKKVTFGWGSIDTRYSRSQIATPVNKLVLYAWRGERVSAQAVLSTPVDIQRMSFTVSDLKSGKNIIPSSCIRKFFVRYVLGNVSGDMKDSLLLADRLDPTDKMKVDAHTTRPMWLDIRVPADAKAGKYTGKLTVEYDGQKQSVPFTLQVSEKTLPAPKDWHFHLDLWQNPYAYARYFDVPLWSKAHFDLMRPQMTLLAEAGQKVITCSVIQHPWNCQTFDPFESMIAKMKQIDGSWKYDYTVFDKWVEFMMSCGIDKQIDCYTFVPWHYTFEYYDCATNSEKHIHCKPGEAAFKDLLFPFLKDFTAHLKQKGWFDISCIAMDERPMDQMAEVLKMVNEADPKWRIEGAANYNPDSELGDRMYDLSVLYRFDLLSKSVLERRREKGQKITFYTCCSPIRPNTFTFSDPAESAFLGWHSMACGYDGYLRWAYCSWTKQPNQDSRYGGWLSGDCYLVYPGCSSIRMERLVEGIQAYEKIRILRETATESQLAQLDALLQRMSLTNYDEGEKAEVLMAEGNALLRQMEKK